MPAQGRESKVVWKQDGFLTVMSGGGGGGRSNKLCLSFMLCCAVLCCAVLCCAVLCFPLLFSAVAHMLC